MTENPVKIDPHEALPRIESVPGVRLHTLAEIRRIIDSIRAEPPVEGTDMVAPGSLAGGVHACERSLRVPL